MSNVARAEVPNRMRSVTQKKKKPIKKQKLTQNADPRKLKMFEDIKKHFGDKGIKIDEEKTLWNKI